MLQLRDENLYSDQALDFMMLIIVDIPIQQYDTLLKIVIVQTVRFRCKRMDDNDRR